MLLVFQSGEIDRLIRDLGHELIEERDRAQRELIKIGSPALPELRKALGSVDAERRARAWAAIIRADRVEMELDHDARQKAALLAKLHPDFLESSKDKPLRFETSYFDLSAYRHREGLVISTEAQHLLMRYEGGRLGGLDLDLEILTETPGTRIEVERCLRCTPRMFFAKHREAGPFKVRLKGTQTWFSRYPLEFSNPRNGSGQRVGDMTVEISWPEVIVRSKEGWSAGSMSMRDPQFHYDLRPDATVTKPRPKGGGVNVGRCGAGMPPPPGWCWCLNGPELDRRGETPRGVHELRLTAATDGVPIEAVSVIRCVVWKPIRIPIDFTVDVTPVKAGD